MKIGPYSLTNSVFVAPMAGVTDRPFRDQCRRFGAGYAVSEMVASNPRLRDSRKTQLRLAHDGEAGLRAVQIVGADPATMADAARYNVEHGAQVIDINMGCPAKKVCNTLAGSALMADEALAARIIDAVCRVVEVPVTVKMRTGPSAQWRNAVAIARAAQDAGAAMIVVHGRSRACGFRGEAEYETIGEVKAALAIPVVANGDIDSPGKARAVLRATGADAVMIGRAALGRPWLYGEIAHFLATGEALPAPDFDELGRRIRDHLHAHHTFYGELDGVRSARKHVGWYLAGLPAAAGFLQSFFQLEHAAGQLEALQQFFFSGAANDRSSPWRQVA